MRTTRIRGSVRWTACVLVLVASAPSLVLAQKAPTPPASSSTANPSDAEKPIHEAAKQFVDAFNKGDAKAVAALWVADGDYVDEAGQRTSGRDAIEKKYAAFFTDNRDAKIQVAIDAVYQVGPDTAIEDGRSKLILAAPAVSESVGRYTVVHVKRNGKWQIASARDLPNVPSPQMQPLGDLDWMIGVWHAEHLGVEMIIDCRWLADKSFVEATFSKRTGDKAVPTATQIIGVDPQNGRITSWMFTADKGYAHGVWIAHDTGWAIEFEGVSADGTPTTAVNVLSRVHDALVWKSTNRTVDGNSLPDTEEVVLKRK